MDYGGEVPSMPAEDESTGFEEQIAIGMTRAESDQRVAAFEFAGHTRPRAGSWLGRSPESRGDVRNAAPRRLPALGDNKERRSNPLDTISSQRLGP